MMRVASSRVVALLLSANVVSNTVSSCCQTDGSSDCRTSYWNKFVQRATSTGYGL